MRSQHYAVRVELTRSAPAVQGVQPRFAGAMVAVGWALAAGWVAVNLAVAVVAPHADFFDAQVQLGAARDLLAGADPYTRYVQNPLWTLLLLAPFALLPGELLYAGHFAGMLLLWFTAAVLLLRTAGVPWGPVKTGVGAGALCCYLPVMWSTHGQITAYVALGLAMALAWWRPAPMWAGAALLLTAAKPHLGVVPAAALVLWAAGSGQWRAAAGLAGAVVAMLLATVAVRPGWIGQWVDAVANPPAEVVLARAKFAPTVTHFAGRWLASEVASVLGVLASAGVGLGLARWVMVARRRLSPPAVVAVAVPATFFITPYAQGYDVSLLAVTGGLLVGVGSRLQGPPRRWLIGGLGGVYVFPYAMQLLGWPQATLLPSAAVCLALAVVNAGAIDPAGGDG